MFRRRRKAARPLVGIEQCVIFAKAGFSSNRNEECPSSIFSRSARIPEPR
jgi:hypothetical protein